MKLNFYKSGITNLWQTFSNISNGDVLQISSFRPTTSWSGLTLEIQTIR